MRISALLLATASVLRAEPVLNESGSLRQLLETAPIPAADSPDKYRLPVAGELDAFRSALGHVLAGDLPAAAAAADGANYRVVSYLDTDSADTFILLREKDTDRHWGGLYAIDASPERALVIECPHPLYDGVRVPAIELFLGTQAVAYLQAGTHRNNSPAESDCDGDLGGDAYRISDMAHQPDGFFQAAHEEIEAHFTRTVSVSFHGMAEGSDPADLVVSNGSSHDFVGHSLSRALAARMNQILADAADPRVAVSHQEPGENPALSGSTNTQGRVSNGSSEPCTTPAATARFPERFLHIECDPDVRDGPSSNRDFVIQALVAEVPLFSDPEPDLATGDLVITEIMPNPAQVGDATGEYVELFNHTGAPVDMTGWSLADRGGNRATFGGIVQPGDLFVVGVSADLNGGGHPGGAPDAVWSDQSGDLTLTDSGDTISVLDANDKLVASVTYGTTTPGTALEIAFGNRHPSGQTAEPDYAAGTTAFGADLGSPGTCGDSQFPLSSFHPVAGVVGNDLVLGFGTAPAVTYTLWHSAGLAGWQPVGGEPPVIGDGLDASFEFVFPADPARFYRLDYDYAAPE